jgi:hypothetical protein
MKCQRIPFRRIGQALIVCSFVVIAFANPLAVFSDSAMSQSHYSVAGLSFGNGGPSNVTFSPGQVNVSHGVTATSTYSSRSVFVMCNWARWNPATQGGIRAVSFRENVITQSSAGQIGVGIIIAQGSGSSVRYYRAIQHMNSASSPQLVSRANLIPSNFEELVSSGSTNGVIPTSHPDFSAGGAPIQFGIVCQKSARTGKADARTSILDWEVSVVPQ